MDTSSNPTERLSLLLDESGYHVADAGTWKLIPALDATREWTMWASTDGAWLYLRTFVCLMPAAASIKAKLVDFILEKNAQMALAKFCILGDRLTIDVDYRYEHLDLDVLRNLIGLLRSVAEQEYPRVFRIVSGDETLDRLEQSLP